MIFAIARARIATGTIVGAAIAAAFIAGSPDGGGGETTTVVLTFPASDAFDDGMLMQRRGLVGGTLARSAFSVTQGGTCYAASFSHGGSRANPVTFDSTFTGCEHAFAALSSGDQTCSAVATAAGAALVSAGASDVTVEGCTVEVAGATAFEVGRPRSDDRNDQGVWGMQRDLAFASGATTNGNMGATGGVHMPSPCDGRVLELCIRADGGENVRLGIGDGPAYSTDPAAVTIDAQCVATAVDNNELGCCELTDPIAIDASDDLWMFFRGSSTEQLRFREHDATPVGRGDLVEDESLIWSALTGDSATPFGSTVDVGGGGGPFALYAHVHFVYECADSGTYPGDGAIDEWIGYQPTTIVGADLTPPSDMVDEIVIFRAPPLPWSSLTMTDIRLGVGSHASGDDFGVGLYSWLPSDIPNFPSEDAATLLQSVGPFGVSTASSFNTHTLASTIDVSDDVVGGDSVSIALNCGRAGGAQATTLQFAYDEDGFAGQFCDLSHWTDDGRGWSDWCDEQGFGVDTEYQGRVSNGSTMPAGDPTATWPDPWAIDNVPTTDGAPLNAPRMAFRVTRPAITGAVN